MDELPFFRLVAGLDAGRTIARLYTFDRHDAVGPVRQRRPRHDLDAMSRFERERRVAGMLTGLDRELTFAAGEVRVTERDTVHHHAIERRLVALGMNGLAQNPADGLRERDRFAAEGRHRALDGDRRFDGREHGSI